MERLLIYISTYNRPCWKLKRFMCPIEVGAKGRTSFLYDCHDDEGKNTISELNPWFGELTGMYWIWKNSDMDGDDIVGLFHYNKHFSLNEKRIRKLMESHDFIAVTPEKSHPHANQKEYLTFLEAMGDTNPSFYQYYENVYDAKGCGIGRGGNMIITRKRLFDEYCQMIFPILFEAHLRIGTTCQSPYYQRHCAFFSERLLQPFLEMKGYRVHNEVIHYLGSPLWQMNCFVIKAINILFPALKLTKKFNLYLRNSGYKP